MKIKLIWINQEHEENVEFVKIMIERSSLWMYYYTEYLANKFA